MNDDAVKFIFDELIKRDKSWENYSIEKSVIYIKSQLLMQNNILPYNFTIEEASVILYYKSTNSWRINQGLRSPDSLRGAEFKFNYLYVDLFNACLDKLPMYGSSTVWRVETYATENQNILKWYSSKIANYIKFPQLLSCSKDFEKINKPNSIIFEIVSSDKSNLHDIGPIVQTYEDDNKEDWESEVIYKTGSVFRIGGILDNRIMLVEVTEADIAPSEVITLANEYYWK